MKSRLTDDIGTGRDPGNISISVIPTPKCSVRNAGSVRGDDGHGVRLGTPTDELYAQGIARRNECGVEVDAE